jgi:type VI secretion system protein ImpJ
MSRVIPDPIQWSEGLLLEPHHFQQLSSRLDSLVQALPTLYVPFYWGVRAFDYNTSDLMKGVLNVRALEVVMPDGLHLALSPRDQLQLDLRALPAGTAQPVLIHLACPLSDGQTPPARQRFWSYRDDPVPDENTGERAVAIPRLRPRVELIAGPEPPARYTSFPLIEVRREGETYFPTEFTPPTLHVAVSSPVGRICTHVCQRLRTKAVHLAEQAIAAPQTAFAAEARFQLHALLSGLPALEAVLKIEPVHPFPLYLELCRLAGHVAILGHSLTPPPFQAYVHDDLRPAFDEVAQFILKAVDEGVPDSVRRFSFVEEQEIFRLPADPEWTRALVSGSEARAVLAVRTDAGESLAVTWAENCVISGRAAIASQLGRRILGFTRRPTGRVGDLMAFKGLYLFELIADGEVMRPEDDLFVLGSTSGVRPDALYLYIVMPTTRETPARPGRTESTEVPG